MTYIIYNVSRPEIEKISEELCNQFTPRQFQEIYFHEMRTPYSFLSVDTRRPLDERIYSRFNYPIRLVDLEGEESSSDEENIIPMVENAQASKGKEDK